MEPLSSSLYDDQLESMETPLITRSSSSHQIPVDAVTTSSNPIPSLSKPLQFLYSLNGVTLAFPMLALTYIVNKRVSMPLADLSVYGALAFCPFSLKPLYAYLSSSKQFRHVWIAILLFINGIITATTALIPSSKNDDSRAKHENAIMICFILALLRGITSAWPEFLLGSTLLDQATTAVAGISDQNPQDSRLEQIVARFQSQAATARNLGSLLAHTGVIAMVFLHQKLQSRKELSDGLVNTMLAVTGIWNVFGAIVALAYQVGLSTEPKQQMQMNERLPYEGDENDANVNHDISEESLLFHNENRHPQYQLELQDELSRVPAHSTYYCKDWSQSGSDALFIVALQLGLILLVLRTPLSNRHGSNNQDDHSHIWMGVGLLSVSMAAIAILAALFCCREQPQHEAFDVTQKLQASQQQRRYRVGAFLIFRHAIPSCNVVMSSFFYSMFQTTPWVLQLFSLTDMAVTTLASWSYGILLAPHSHGWKFLIVIAATTVGASVAEVLYLLITPSLAHHRQHHHSVAWISIVILVKAVVTFSSEWRFLPDVVLATSSAATTVATEARSCNCNEMLRHDSMDQPYLEGGLEQDARAQPKCDLGNGHDSNLSGNRSGVQPSSNQPQLWYGTLISCIDFGDQIGSWLTVPLVAALNITRENDWAHLHVLVGLGSFFGIMTLLFLNLLKPPTQSKK